MRKLVFFLVLIILITPLVDGVATGGQLPRWGRTCETVMVHGNPYGTYPLYQLGEGIRVQMRDRSRPDGTWVMIAPAEWIPIKSLCDW